MSRRTLQSAHAAARDKRKKALKIFSKEIFRELFQKGLSNSTWAERYPDALAELATYEADIRADIERVADRLLS